MFAHPKCIFFHPKMYIFTSKHHICTSKKCVCTSKNYVCISKTCVTSKKFSCQNKERATVFMGQAAIKIFAHWSSRAGPKFGSIFCAQSPLFQA